MDMHCVACSMYITAYIFLFR